MCATFFVDEISPSTCAADERYAKPKKRAEVLYSELGATDDAIGMLSENLVRAKICKSKLGTRLGKVETKRDAAKARYDELEQQFDSFIKVLLGQEEQALIRCQGSVAGLFMESAEDLLAPTIAGHEKAALRQETAAANEKKVHASQICKLHDQFDKLAAKLSVVSVETLQAKAAEKNITGLF